MTTNNNAKTPAAPVNGAPPRHAEENWDQRLGFLMHDVSRLRRTAFDQYMKPLNITRSQWWVLAYLSRHDGMIQSDLANMLDLGKAALGSLVDRLSAAGLVRRGADETDRRAKRVYLTPAGALLIKEMSQRSHEMSERILEGLDVEDRHRLAEMLDRVKQNLLNNGRDRE
jgi:MarR family transcriptional regulator for hemolysin